MALPHTIYRLKLDISDVDRNVYEQVELRVAQHPSETDRYLVTRLLALSLHIGDGAVFSGAGLKDPDLPAVLAKDPTGLITHWIDIGHPSSERIHKASKRAGEVWIYSHKDPNHLVRNLAKATIHRREDLQIASFEPTFLDGIARLMGRSADLTIVRTEGTLFVTVDGETVTGRVDRHRVEAD